MYGILILLDMFKRYPRFGFFHSQSTRMKKAKQKKTKIKSPRKKQKFSFIISVYRKTIYTRS